MFTKPGLETEVNVIKSEIAFCFSMNKCIDKTYLMAVSCIIIILL